MRGNEEFDASGDAGLAADQAGSLEGEEHLVYRGWGDAEVALHVGLGGGASEHARIGVDEVQILALLSVKLWSLRRRAVPDF